jgi:RND superfamily putative drug exporter
MSRTTSRKEGLGSADRPGFTERLARGCARHPRRTIAVWAAIIVAAIASMPSLLGSGLTSKMEQHGEQPDSAIGLKLMEGRLTGQKRMTDFVIVQSGGASDPAGVTVNDPAFEAYVTGIAREIEALGPDVVESVATFYQTGDPTMVSRDERKTLIAVVLAGDTDHALDNVAKLHEQVVASAAEGAAEGFTLAQTGEASLNKMGNDLAKSDMERAEVFGVPVALAVLLVVFGAVLAAVMPLVLSVISIVMALALTGLIGQIYPMNVFMLNILTTMGLAVGIDYTLFFISRYREERERGLEVVDAIAATGATASRAIFFSGMTVVLAMVGMAIVPVDITISMGAGVMLVVFTTLLATLTLLPAATSVLGDRVNALRLPLVGRLARRHTEGEGVWERLSHSIMRRPVIWLTAAVALLLLAASPVVLMHTGGTAMTATGYPDDEYAKQGWDILGRDFSLGKANPVQIVVDGQAGSAAVTGGVARLLDALTADRRFGPAQVAVNEAGDLTLVSVPLAGDPAGDETQAVIERLRADVVPAAFADMAAHVYVAGTTAGVVDYLDFFDFWLPIALAVVLGLSFILLLVAFRSVVIPAKAILMNLLSVGAAYGLMVLVFQKGVGAELLGFTKVDTIEAWVPLFLFSLLFGLSMDYQVFLLSRIKERYDHTGDTREAVAHGVGRTAGIITGAAAIMVCVFAGNATGELVMFQQMGFGLAVAIFIDATIVRTIVVPAGMELLGDWNWYLPRWLEWLPNVSVEGCWPVAGEAMPADDAPSSHDVGPGFADVPVPHAEGAPGLRAPAHWGAPAAR